MHAVTHTKRAWQAESDLTRLWQESESIHRHHSRSVHCVGTHLAMNSSLLQRRLSLLTDQERKENTGGEVGWDRKRMEERWK